MRNLGDQGLRDFLLSACFAIGGEVARSRAKPFPDVMGHRKSKASRSGSSKAFSAMLPFPRPRARRSIAPFVLFQWLQCTGTLYSRLLWTGLTSRWRNKCTKSFKKTNRFQPTARGLFLVSWHQNKVVLWHDTVRCSWFRCSEAGIIP